MFLVLVVQPVHLHQHTREPVHVNLPTWFLPTWLLWPRMRALPIRRSPPARAGPDGHDAVLRQALGL